MSVARFASLAVVIVVMLDVYWLIAVIVGPRNVGVASVTAGIIVQALGVGGLLAKANGSHALSGVAVWPFFLAAFLGSTVLWRGLFHADELRSSPSIWRSAILVHAPDA